MAQVSYSLSVKDAHGHICLVETRVRGVKKGPIELVMPAWAPGSYIIRDYAKNVITFEAKDAKGRALTWKKRTKGRWRVDARGGDVVATYSIYANELNVRSSHIDASHGFFTGSSIFMYVEGLRSEPVEVSVKPLKGWKVATGLKKVRNGVYWAKDYDELIDCPIEMSEIGRAHV